MLNRTQKTELANQVAESFKKAQVAVFADYKGISAPEADELRKKMREAGAEVRVLKNNVARLAAKSGDLGGDIPSVVDSLAGPTMVAFAFDDAAKTAKIFHEFAKGHEALEIKESLMGDKKVSPAEVEALASLPSREVLLAQVLSALNGPARGLVTVLSAVPRDFVNVLSAVKDQKDAG